MEPEDIILAMFSMIGYITSIHSSMTSWPTGNYVLLKPATGCPAGWPQKTGWIYQDTEDTMPGNNRSLALHIDGYVGASYVLRSFCIKTDSRGTLWPKGQYCFYNKFSSSCPPNSETSLGIIQWDDENSSNQNKLVSPLPYATNHRKNLQLRFCCSTSGDKAVPIKLPTSRPFYLLAYNSSKCQQVEWMVATTEWIKYNREKIGTDYSQQSGSVPYNTLNKERDITMYYCYYQSCNYTLSSPTGSFKSPCYPDRYPDGQLCAWTIKVPANYTSVVTFDKKFLLDKNNKNDYLDYYDKINESYILVRRFDRNDAPSVLMSHSSDVMFVFRTDKEYNSYGFRAEYEIVPTEEFHTTTASSTLQPKTTEQVTTATILRTVSTNETSTHANYAKASACQSNTWTVILIVIPLVCLAVVVALVIDIWCRCRHRNFPLKAGKVPLSCHHMAVNGVYDCEMIVSPCSTITRPTTHGNNGQEYKQYQTNEDQDFYQNTNQAFCHDNFPPCTSPTRPRGISVQNDLYLEPQQCMSEDHPSESCEYTEAIERSANVSSAEYGYIESHGEEPRAVSGEYGYLEPFGYVPRSDSEEAPIETQRENDILPDVKVVNGDGVTVSDDNPIYEYDNICEELDSDEDLYACVD